MKTLKFFLILAFAACTMMFYSCGGQEESGQETEATEQVEQAPSEEATPASEEQGPEYTSKYICPMHCEGSGSAEPGKCPVCGMDYVMNENYQEGHDHEGHDHEGHDHN